MKTKSNIKPWPKDNKHHRWDVAEETGWMPFYHGVPYWPLHKTKAEAVKYATWKMAYPGNRKATIVKCTVKTITMVKRHASKKRAAACGEGQ